MSKGNDGNVEAGGAGFILGLLTGTILGAAIGMLLAPKEGRELRGELEEHARHFGAQAREFSAKASEGYQRASEAAIGLADRGREVVNHAREAVKTGAEDLRGFGGRNATAADVDGPTANEAATGAGDVSSRA